MKSDYNKSSIHTYKIRSVVAIRYHDPEGLILIKSAIVRWRYQFDWLILAPGVPSLSFTRNRIEPNFFF